jgi:hypothetical protein
VVNVSERARDIVVRTEATFRGGDIATVAASTMAEALDTNRRSVALVIDRSDLTLLLALLDRAGEVEGVSAWGREDAADLAAAIRASRVGA